MTNMVFHAHSGVRYLVLLVGIVALVAFLYGQITRKPVGPGKGIMAAFVGVLDLQLLLGLVLVFLMPFYGALIGHLVLMIAAVAVAHASASIARNKPDATSANSIRLIGVVVTLVLIVGGIMSIGRSIF